MSEITNPKYPEYTQPQTQSVVSNKDLWGPAFDEYTPYWTQYFSNAFWEVDSYGSWNGSAWVGGVRGGQYIVDIEPIGTWMVDYRPTKMRIAHTHPSALLVTLIAGGTAYDSGDYTYTTGLEVDITCAADIASLSLISPDFTNYTVTNIEFYL